MWRKPLQIIGISSMILIGASGVAIPVATADEAEMPDLVEMTLDEAQAEFAEAAANPELVLESSNITGPKQEQLVPIFWKVCEQSPEAGEPIAEEESYEVGVVRAGEEC
ncbi:hypothetical protein O6P37_10300 [Mycobacterium sp. CPCC 205372]|uniref:PASTA domain-containing protein n=1 Tax=Mycobacterium hippophais TaxID=3016340 RepID=A0ABT4PRY5_9MYCO|nr:hypothetical protein [Mycobacterium hippophais]MCZ8379254.1 hypothetical protein [Mycobacterium hippophais]